MGTSSITGEDTIVFSDNASYDGTERGGVLVADGKIWMGDTSDGGIRIGEIVPGTNVSVIYSSEPMGASKLTISSTQADVFEWNEITGTTGAFLNLNGYITNNPALVTMTLPPVCAVGDTFRIAGLGAGGWLVAQNAGQIIHFGNMDTTSGVTGSLASTNRYDCLEFLCVATNNEFLVLSSVGNITVA